MSRSDIIDNQHQRTQALLASLSSPTVANDQTQAASNLEFQSCLQLTTQSVIALSAVDSSTGTAPTLPAGARLLIGAEAEASRGRAGVADAAARPAERCGSPPPPAEADTEKQLSAKMSELKVKKKRHPASSPGNEPSPARAPKPGKRPSAVVGATEQKVDDMDGVEEEDDEERDFLDNVLDSLELKPDLMGILKVLHKNHKDVYNAILAKPEFDDGGYKSVAIRLIRAIAEAVLKGAVLRAYRDKSAWAP